jgi:uncharacterized protein HemY
MTNTEEKRKVSRFEVKLILLIIVIIVAFVVGYIVRGLVRCILRFSYPNQGSALNALWI